MATGPVRVEGLSVAVLAKAPVPGQVKTRLAATLGPVAAARLHRQLVLRTLQTVRQAGMQPQLWGEPISHRFFQALSRRHGCPLWPQPSGDIGMRMHAAFIHHARRSPLPLLLVGSDCPVLQPSHLQEAGQRLLTGEQAVFIPAEDGGYVLVGLRSPVAGLFEHIDWSTDRVMAQTRASIRRLGLSHSELPRLWDIDRPEDWLRWQAMQDA